MTQLEEAVRGVISPIMRQAALTEPLDDEEIRNHIAAGNTVILKSQLHDCTPVAIGKGLKIKINAYIGTSNYNVTPKMELEKLRMAVKYGADTIMDLSTGGDIREMRLTVLSESQYPSERCQCTRLSFVIPPWRTLARTTFWMPSPRILRMGWISSPFMRSHNTVHSYVEFQDHGGRFTRGKFSDQMDDVP